MQTFTENQTRAIESDSREIMCIAGAGSGKTRVLTERIARMLIEGVKPSSFLVLTFTRRAANEMRGRLITILGGDDNAQKLVSQITLGTFHSIAYRILRTWGERLGYDAKYLTVVPPNEADTLLRQVATEFGYYNMGKVRWLKGMSWKKVGGWRESIYTGAEPEVESQTERTILESMFAEYCNRLRSAQAMDFGLILQEVKRLLKTHNDIRQIYNSTIEHVFVDEAQDLDEFQHGMLFHFWPPATMFFVGDIRQSVYQFRNARPDLLAKLVAS